MTLKRERLLRERPESFAKCVAYSVRDGQDPRSTLYFSAIGTDAVSALVPSISFAGS
jgi:hypothetical protein